MNVYDFDNTIYDGESTVDFFLFCVKKDKKLLRFLPLLMVKLIKYKLCLIQPEELERYAEKYAWEFLELLGDLRQTVCSFWDLHQNRIKPFYLARQTEEDVILSASCDFLLEEICRRLHIKTCICSQFDVPSRKFRQLCYQQKKTDLFRALYPSQEIDAFYTDSMNDKPMIDLAKHAYLVKGKRIHQIK